MIRAGVSAELDELRHVSSHAKELLLEVQRRESDRTGIPSLKVGFNNVFGYYLEVRNTHKDKVPPEWVRKQTLVGAERYITDELKTLEEKILGAEERILALEPETLRDLVEAVVEQVGDLRSLAAALAEWDVLRAFAANAKGVELLPARARSRSAAWTSATDGIRSSNSSCRPVQPYVANDLLLGPG